MTVDTDEADGAASNHKYEYTITVVASTSTEAADPDSTKIFTADFCPDYNPIVTVVMTDVTFERNSGS